MSIYRLLRVLLLFVSCIGLSAQAGAQCVTINNLPDTILACKNTTVQLSPTITSPGLLQTLDTTWTPSAGLSNPNIINPVVTVGTASAQYLLTVPALTANNFVTNGDFSSGNTGFSSAYIVPSPPYGTYGQLSNEGTYAVTTNANNVHTNFSSFTDHTGNAGGQMMVINGAASSSTNIWCETITVVPNTSYDFSAWGASATASSPAVLQFSINGTLLGTALTLPATTGQWTQFHAIWFSGANTSINICINDQQTATSGNDFAIDDIAFRQICTAKDSVYIKVINLTPSITSVIHRHCASDSVYFTAQGGTGNVPTTFKWDFGDGSGSVLQNPGHQYSAQNTYTVKLTTAANGCKDSASVSINTRHPLAALFNTSKDTVCAGTPVKFTSADVVSGPATYYWSFGDGTTDNTAAPSHNYAVAGVYHVYHVIKDTIPCTDTFRKTVVVLPGPAATFTASDSLICVGQHIDFLTHASPGWDTLMLAFGDGTVLMGETAQAHAYDAGGSFITTLTAAYPQCPTITLTKNIQVVAPPKLDIGPDTALCPNANPIMLSVNPGPGATLLWSTGDVGNTTTANKPGTYWVSATVPPGCSAADSITIRNDCYLDVPNAFTPNGDGMNDYFFPRQLLSESLQAFTMQIFDRWGELIYQTTNINGSGWDGKFNDVLQPEGVYIYLIKAVVKGGGLQQYHGNVTLLK